ncbi:MAG: Rieske 2Fe-2S domain-containing protein [Planctomycetota bacterium]|nr:Rieske 2Fe-2S domain-containing protein [Planctomycetota bacterium]
MSDNTKSDAQKEGCVGCGCAGANKTGGTLPPVAAPDARRGFMFKFGAGLLGIGGVLTALPIVGYIVGPARSKYRNEWVDLGSTTLFPSGHTRFATFLNPIRQPTDGDSAKTACWVRCVEAGKFQVFAINCAHLGCPVRWFEQSKLFMCPCHGGVYYQDGSRAAGPPPRGLFEYKWKVEGGKLLIDAGRLPGLEESV